MRFCRYAHVFESFVCLALIQIFSMSADPDKYSLSLIAGLCIWALSHAAHLTNGFRQEDASWILLCRSLACPYQ